jgi:mono/diheme cytochrome c family protein
VLVGPAAAQEGPTWAEVGPLLAERCVRCHSGAEAPDGLSLDSHAAAIAGSWFGPVLKPGDVEGSELVRRVKGLSRPAMPLAGGPLSEDEIGLIEAWVLAGLPQGEAPAVAMAPGEPAVPAEGQPVTWAHVEGIFLRRCAECHSDAREGGPPEGLRLSTLEEVLTGGERVALVPGHAQASEIVRRIEGLARPRMPHDGPPWLTGEQIALIRRWIDDGARDAEGEPSPVPVGAELRLRGRMTGKAEIDGVPFAITGATRIDDRPGVGEEAEVRGVVTEDGGVEATRWRDR